MSQINNRSVLTYEVIGMVFIILLGSALHFTFEWSGNQPIVGAFSAVNESVWEHLKLAFWPSLLFMLVEYALLNKKANNFALAKTVGVYTMVAIIPIIFYSYTAIIKDNALIARPYLCRCRHNRTVGKLQVADVQEARTIPQYCCFSRVGLARSGFRVVHLLPATIADLQGSNKWKIWNTRLARDYCFVNILGSFHSSLRIPYRSMSLHSPYMKKAFRKVASLLNPAFSMTLTDGTFR